MAVAIKAYPIDPATRSKPAEPVAEITFSAYIIP